MAVFEGVYEWVLGISTVFGGAFALQSRSYPEYLKCFHCYAVQWLPDFLHALRPSCRTLGTLSPMSLSPASGQPSCEQD